MRRYIKSLDFTVIMVVIVNMMLFSCISTRNIPDHKPIYFSNINQYDMIDLKLSDIANVEYVALKGEPFDTMIFNQGLCFYLDSINQNIYCVAFGADEGSRLFKYDLKGNYIQHLNTIPNNYLSIGSVRDFYILPKKDRVGIQFYFERSIYLYDTKFTHIKEIKNIPPILDLKQLNNKRVLLSTSKDKKAYNKKRENRKKGVYYTMSPLNGRYKGCYDINYICKIKTDESIVNSYDCFQYGDGGIFIHYMLSDSIMWIDKSGRKLYPRMIDVSGSPDTSQNIHISCETKKYIFFNEFENSSIKFYVYDKSEDKIFDLGYEYTFSEYSTAFRPKYYKDLLSDKCVLSYRNNSKNERMLVEVIPTKYFKNYNHKEGSQASEVAANMTGDESAVIAIIRLK